jgi:hypothetical protein
MESIPFGKHSWPTVEFPLASLGLRVDAIAARLKLPVHAWNNEGLGSARGLGCRLPSGRLFLLMELQLKVQYYDAKGPTVYVDAGDLIALGAESLLEEILAALNLSPSDVARTVDRTDEEQAAQWLRDFQARSNGTYS